MAAMSRSAAALARQRTSSKTADIQRYASIRSFFARQGTATAFSRQHTQLAHQRSSFSTSRSTSRNDDDQKPPQREGNGERSRQPGHNHDETGPFANYPRSLRELAMRSASHTGPSNSSSSSRHAEPSSSTTVPVKATTQPPAPSQPETSPQDPPAATPPVLPSYRRPTKEELLQYARGFWTRFRIRFKWFTIRGFRRFNADDFSAFFTLGGLGTIVLVVVGTTTAVSVVLWGLDVLNMQHWIARKIADYLTSQTGITVVFESAIVPKWKDSRICFQNVFMTRRAQANDPESLRRERAKKRKARLRREGEAASTTTGAGKRGEGPLAPSLGMPWEGISWEDVTSPNDDVEVVAPPLHPSATGEDLTPTERESVDTNFTMFDLNVDTIEVTLSISRWFEGKGLVEDASVKGVRGIIDRRNVMWDPEKPYDPKAARRVARQGDFELESLDVSDVLVTIYQPGGFRPFNFSVFNATVPKLRKQWLFYDLLGAESITGQVDGCLFSLHKPQSIGRTHEKEKQLSESTGRWRTISRLRIDGVNIDHIQSQSQAGQSGPLSWILSGRFDVVADIRFPRDSADDVDINTIINEIVDNLANAVSGGPPPTSPSKRIGGGGGSDAGREKRVKAGRSDESEDEESDGEEEHDDSSPIPGQHKLDKPAISAPLTAIGPAAEKAWRESIKGTGLDTNDEGGREPGARLRHEREEMRRNSWRRRLKAAIFSSSGEDPPPMQDEDLVDDHQVQQPEEHTSNVVAGPPRGSEQDAPPPPIPPPSVIIDLDVRFKDLKAAVPLLHSSLPYSQQAFVRPIVAFMNAHRTLIPLTTRIVMDLGEFDGSLDLAQTGLLPLVSEQMYEALARHVESEAEMGKRWKRVGEWGVKSALWGLLGVARRWRDALE